MVYKVKKRSVKHVNIILNGKEICSVTIATEDENRTEGLKGDGNAEAKMRLNERNYLHEA